jgi:hypothetical protein
LVDFILTIIPSLLIIWILRYQLPSYCCRALRRLQGLDALMHALTSWNGGVIIISHDERFITTVAKEVSILMILQGQLLPCFPAMGLCGWDVEKVQR